MDNPETLDTQDTGWSQTKQKQKHRKLKHIQSDYCIKHIYDTYIPRSRRKSYYKNVIISVSINLLFVEIPVLHAFGFFKTSLKKNN